MVKWVFFAIVLLHPTLLMQWIKINVFYLILTPMALPLSQDIRGDNGENPLIFSHCLMKVGWGNIMGAYFLPQPHPHPHDCGVGLGETMGKYNY